LEATCRLFARTLTLLPKKSQHYFEKKWSFIWLAVWLVRRLDFCITTAQHNRPTSPGKIMGKIKAQPGQYGSHNLL
jgi:hypothetical protein